MGCICSYSQQKKHDTSPYQSLTRSLRDKLDQINFQTPVEATTIDEKEEILNSYQIIKKIGKGLFSRVFLATDEKGNKLALKIIKKKNFLNKENIQKIIIEKEVLKLVEHPNILKLYRTIQTNSKLVFVLEYAAKGNLINILNQRPRISEDEVRFIIAQICEALVHIHSKGIIYGDLKAENILVTEEGIIKLCDFNLSGTSSLLNDAIQGTVNYLAPEIIAGLPRTMKSDFWSLGVLVHLLFYRRFPFKSQNQSELFYNIVNKPIDPEEVDLKASRELRTLITQLLNKNYKQRLGNSIQDFVQHKFFRKFDWKNYKNQLGEMGLVKSVASFDDPKQGLDESDESGKLKKSNASNDKFHYNITGFTYDDRTTNMRKSLVNNGGSFDKKDIWS